LTILGHRDAKFLPLLIEALESSGPGLRFRAASALGLYGREAKQAIPALCAAVSDPLVDVRRAALGPLFAIGREMALGG
jgi:HEAT repeat protein